MKVAIHVHAYVQSQYITHMHLSHNPHPSIPLYQDMSIAMDVLHFVLLAHLVAIT